METQRGEERTGEERKGGEAPHSTKATSPNYLVEPKAKWREGRKEGRKRGGNNKDEKMQRAVQCCAVASMSS